MRERLVYLFVILDRSPRDGGISLGELEAWLRRQAAARLEAVTRREMAMHDKDGDGAVALREYIGICTCPYVTNAGRRSSGPSN